MNETTESLIILAMLIAFGMTLYLITCDPIQWRHVSLARMATIHPPIQIYFTQGENVMSEPTRTTSATAQGAGPVEEFRSGAVRATIWRNEIPRDGETVAVHNIQIYRTYRDQDGEWHESSSFRERDLLDLDIVRQEAARFLRLRRRSDQNFEQSPAADEEVPI